MVLNLERPPVDSHQDTLTACRTVSEQVQAFVDSAEQGRLVGTAVAHDEGDTTEGRALAEAASWEPLRKHLAGITERLWLAALGAAPADREDMLKLLGDPLSSETRTTRRNVGGLAALAILLGIGGHIPKTLLGISLEGFRGWEIPLVLSGVLAYEYIAFRHYLATDLALRRIHEERAAGYRSALDGAIKHFDSLRPVVARLAEKARLDDESKTKLSQVMAHLYTYWTSELQKFVSELAIQTARRRWDADVPKWLFVVAIVALASLSRLALRFIL